MILDHSWLFTIFGSRNFSGAWFSTVLPHGSFCHFQNTLTLIRIPNEKQAVWVLLTYLLTTFCTKNFRLDRLFRDISAHVTRILLKTTFNIKLLNHQYKLIIYQWWKTRSDFSIFILPVSFGQASSINFWHCSAVGPSSLPISLSSKEFVWRKKKYWNC